MRLAMLLGISCWLAATSGCGGGNDGGGSSAGSGAPDAAVATNQLILTATDARLRKRFGVAKPVDGHVFVDVLLSLRNTGEARPLSASPFRFSLQTSDALVYASNGTAAQLPKACSDNVSVATGGHLNCKVGFEILVGEMASTLLYADPAEPVERDASAPIGPVRPALAVCSYWKSPTPPNCANCVTGVASGTCSVAFNAMADACQFSCVTSDSCPLLIPMCMPIADCATALDAYQTCIYEQCFSFCPLAE
jgi:hypothetical protein